MKQKQSTAKIREEYSRRLITAMKSLLNAGNLIKAIISSNQGYQVNQDRSGDIQRQTRAMLTKQRGHHTRSSVLSTTLPRKEGGPGITDIVNFHTSQTINLTAFFLERPNNSSLHIVVTSLSKYFLSI